jgi:hypothetical protein
MKKDMFKMSLIVILGMTVLSCESQKEISSNYVEGRIIGFDPCSGGSDATVEGRGFVIALNNSSDTLVTYNLPVNLFVFPKELFSGYLGSFLFPDSAKNSYKIRFSYRYSTESEKVHPICLGTIYLADYNKYVRDRQIVVENVSKN